MEMIKSNGLIYEYYTYDEGDKIESVHRALDQVDICVNKGEFIAILGHNGSGKSTFAKHINALLKPTNGTIFIKGYDSSQDDNVWNIRQSAGMVFQNPDNQIIATIVEEDVAFGPENLGIEPAEIRKRVDNSLAVVGMSEYMHHSPNKLSGGQKQRIAIAGVLAMEPECIVLDEPTAMLDPIGRKEVIKTILGLNKEKGITTVLITHYMEEVIHADRVFVMEQGKIVLEGTPREVFSQVDRLKEIRLDVPQVTEVAHLLKAQGVQLPEGILSIEEMVDAVCQLL